MASRRKEMLAFAALVLLLLAFGASAASVEQDGLASYSGTVKSIHLSDKPKEVSLNAATRNRRDVLTRLKELLGMVPKKDLKAEEIKIEEEIAVVETAEEMLESDLNHMKHTKHTSADREKLEVEIDAMKKLDSDLVKQNEVIQDIIAKDEQDEKDVEYEYKKSEERSEQSDFEDFEEYSRDYMDNSKSKSDEYSSDSDDTYGSEYEDESDSTSDYDDFTDRKKRTVDGKKKNHCRKWYRINKKKLMEEEKKKNMNMAEKENKKNMVEKEEKKKMMEKEEKKKMMEKEEKKKMMEKKEKKKMMEKKEKKKMMEKKEKKKIMEKKEKKKMMEKKEKKSMVEKKEKEDKKNSISKSLSDDKSDDMLTLDVVASLYKPSSDKIEVHTRRKQREIDTTQMDIRSLIRRILTGVSKAGKGEGLSVTEARDLQRDIWSLEQQENEIVKDLMGVANGGKQLDELEMRVALVQLLEELDFKLERKISDQKLLGQRVSRSVAQPNVLTKRSATWVSALMNQRDVAIRPLVIPADNGKTYHHRNGQKTDRERRRTHIHHKAHKHKPHTSTTHAGKKDLGRCARCEEMVGEEVCGGNGKNYNSLCHAVNCGGLLVQDIRVGPCSMDNVCEGVKCEGAGECVPLTNGVCLTLYSSRKRLPCRQYMCVSEGACTSDVHSHVCGLNGKSYHSLCYLHKAEVQLAYSGACRPELCRESVCGRDGVTYTSVCHARASGMRVDYPGDCYAESKYPRIHGCADVMKAGRCPKPACNNPVRPKDSCCPLCGGALVVHPDTQAMATLISTWKDVNHMYIIENFLRKLLSPKASKKCELSATLTNAGNISVVLESLKPGDYSICRASAKQLAKEINGHYPDMEDSMLRPMAKTAALLGALNPLGGATKWLQDTQARIVGGVKGSVGDGVKYANQKTSDLEGEHIYGNRGSVPTGSLLLLALSIIVMYLI